MPALISLPFLSKYCIGHNSFPLYLLILIAEEGAQNKKAGAMNNYYIRFKTKSFNIYKNEKRADLAIINH